MIQTAYESGFKLDESEVAPEGDILDLEALEVLGSVNNRSLGS
jgi:hypothetical protein